MSWLDIAIGLGAVVFSTITYRIGYLSGREISRREFVLGRKAP
jgi:hypothetical protein